MGKIFFISGKSSTGKDTIYKRLLEDESLGFKKITLYTTRPMREGEVDGVEYFFTTPEKTSEYEQDGSVIDMHIYNTVYGPWKYYTRNDGQIDIHGDDIYLVVGTIEVYRKYCDYFGKENVIPIYIEVEDGDRIIRAVEREKTRKVPQYREMCRRFIADDDDFSEENLAECGITRRFENIELEECINHIKKYIFEKINS